MQMRSVNWLISFNSDFELVAQNMRFATTDNLYRWQMTMDLFGGVKIQFRFKFGVNIAIACATIQWHLFLYFTFISVAAVKFIQTSKFVGALFWDPRLMPAQHIKGGKRWKNNNNKQQQIHHISNIWFLQCHWILTVTSLLFVCLCVFVILF